MNQTRIQNFDSYFVICKVCGNRIYNNAFSIHVCDFSKEKEGDVKW
jgi:translation initiation factor 2 beta subunit (eIF-2beta)/eIF-5